MVLYSPFREKSRIILHRKLRQRGERLLCQENVMFAVKVRNLAIQ